MTRRVLYVSHTGVVGGGERSLLELLRRLPDEVEPVLATPPGALAGAAAERGVRVVEIAGVAASLGRLPGVRAAVDLVRSARTVRAAAGGFDVVHANSVRAGLVAMLSCTRVPTVVEVRDCLPAGALASGVQRLVAAHAARVVANSAYTAACFAAATGARPRVAYPIVDVARFAAAGARRGARGSAPLLGVVAQITPWKGQRDAIEAFALVRRELPDARLVLIGNVQFESARFDNTAYERALHRLVRDLDLVGSVEFAGHCVDPAAAISALDLLLVPSWHEPFGRVVVEGMAAGVPVVATAAGGPSEVLDGGCGLLLPPRQPRTWAEAASALLRDPARLEALAARGRERALARFDPTRQVEATLALYRELAPGGRAPAVATTEAATQ